MAGALEGVATPRPTPPPLHETILLFSIARPLRQESLNPDRQFLGNPGKALPVMVLSCRKGRAVEPASSPREGGRAPLDRKTRLRQFAEMHARTQSAFMQCCMPALADASQGSIFARADGKEHRCESRWLRISL